MKNIELLESVFRDAVAQVEKGKGAQRHGQTGDIVTQPAFWISEHFGLGFLLGQTVKKMHEAQERNLGFDEWEKEMLGALAYLGLAIASVRHRLPEDHRSDRPDTPRPMTAGDW